MRHFLLVAFAAFLVLSGGCGPVTPMTESEFKGFCYQVGEGRTASCDTISICDPYTAVMNTPQPSQKKCLAECDAVYGPQAMAYALAYCQGPAQSARDWCYRYCQTNYPK